MEQIKITIEAEKIDKTKSLFNCSLVFIIFLFLNSYNVFGQSCSSYTDWYPATWSSGQVVELAGTGKLYTPTYSSTAATLTDSWTRCEVSSPCTNFWKLAGTCTYCTNRTVGSASSSPTPIKNTLMTSITHATTQVTGIASSSGLPSGVSASYSSNVITISGTPTVAGTYNYTITPTSSCGSATAIGTITVSVPLPIELSLFNAELKEDLVEITWETTTEKNNDYFILENSYDTEKWFIIAKIKGNNNSNTVSKYYWKHKINFIGLCYYRLSQVDFDGTKERFNTILLKNSSTKKLNEIILYPNPLSNYFSLEYFSENEDVFNILIKTDNGQELYNQNHNINKGKNIINISSETFKQGTYLVVIENNVSIKVIKKIIKN
jgi:hypothetical protein